MDEKILAYLAGFIDADGSITIVMARYKDKSGKLLRVQYRARLSACNCKIAPIQLLQDTFGSGKVRLRNWKGKKKKNWKPNYEWMVTNAVATSAIRQLLPYLRIKGEQGGICLQLQEGKNKYSAATRRWNRTLDAEVQAEFDGLKTRCNVLNKRGQ